MCIAKLLHLGVWICLYKFMYLTATEPIISIDFRRRVPKDLLSLYPSDRIIFSLKTRDRKEATRLARAESVRLDQEFERHGVTPASGILVHGGDNEHTRLRKPQYGQPGGTHGTHRTVRELPGGQGSDLRGGRI